MTNQTEREALDFSPLALLLWSYRKVLLIAAFVSFTGSLVLSFFMSPVYESFSVIYPAQSSTIEKNLDGLEFGFDVHAERIIQILESDAVRDSMAERFDLLRHYHIDTTQLDWADKFSEKFYANFDFVKSKYKSVVVQVRDRDPNFAARMANEILPVLNKVNEDIIHANAKDIFSVYYKSMNDHLAKVNQLTDSILRVEREERAQVADKYLGEIRMRQEYVVAMADSLSGIRSRLKFGDLNEEMNLMNLHLADARERYLYEDGLLRQLEQTEETPDSTLNRLRASKEGARQTVDFFTQRLAELAAVQRKYSTAERNLTNEEMVLLEARTGYDDLVLSPRPELGSRKLDRLVEEYNYETIQLNIVREQFRKALLNYTQPGPAAFPISKASPSWKPVKPVIWMNVMVAVVFTLFMTVVSILVIEKVKQLKAAQRAD